MILPGVGSMMAGLSKSAPEVIGSVQSSTNDFTGGTWAPTLAAHQAGDVLVVLIAARHASDEDFGVDVGWTDVVSPSVGATTRLKVIRRTAVSGATTLTITNNQTTENTRMIVHSYTCRFANGSVDNSWITASRDPASLTPVWGSENNLWIVANMTLDTAPATGPAGFANGVQSSGGSVKLTTLDRAIESPTLDPSAFAGTAGANDITITLAVRPA